MISPINQTGKHSTCSDKYGFVSTEELLNTFSDRGWVVDSQSIAVVRREDKKGFQKHLIRMVHPNFPAIPGLTENNKSRPQLVLLNSHDGTTRLRVFTGLLRVACLNGMIAGKSMGEFSAIHNQNVIKNLELGIEGLMESFPRFYSQIARLQNTQFSVEQLNTLLEYVTDLRLGKTRDVIKIYRETLWSPLRAEDGSLDAFTILNRIQEKLLRGGIVYSRVVRQHDRDGKVTAEFVQIKKTPAVKSIPVQLNYNQSLYDKAMEILGVA